MNKFSYDNYGSEIAYKMIVREVLVEINDRHHYVRISDPNGDLTDRQLKNKAWAHLKQVARVEIRS